MTRQNRRHYVVHAALSEGPAWEAKGESRMELCAICTFLLPVVQANWLATLEATTTTTTTSSWLPLLSCSVLPRLGDQTLRAAERIPALADLK
jgi:hypothetical protein